MKRLLISLTAILVLAFPGPVLADYISGHFTDSNGLSCNYSGTEYAITVNCSGYVYRNFSYTCTHFGYSWDCS